MKLLIVRHGDPDYSIDSLTETGWIEAELLSDRLCKLDVKAFYCSPKGRARDTAKATLEKLGRQAEILPWLREFSPQVLRPGRFTSACTAAATRVPTTFLPSFGCSPTSAAHGRRNGSEI